MEKVKVVNPDPELVRVYEALENNPQLVKLIEVADGLPTDYIEAVTHSFKKLQSVIGENNQ